MNELEIPKIKSKIEIGMHLWVLNTSHHYGNLYSIQEIIVTGFILNKYSNYIILCDGENTNGYDYSQLRKTVFFTKESADKKVIALKTIDVINAELETKRKAQQKENDNLCKQWLLDHGNEYIGREVMVKIGHDDYLKDTIKSLQSSRGSTVKDIYFCGNIYWNIYKLNKENKTWYFITKETKLAALKKEYDKKIAEIENEEKKNAK